MGFVREPALFTLTFGGELAGLEIRVRGMSGDSWIELGQLGDYDKLLSEPTPAVPLFMAHVDRWNLERADGISVPVTVPAFLGYDTEFIRAVVASWLRKVVPAPYAATPSTNAAVVPTAPPPEPAVESWTPSEPDAVDWRLFDLGKAFSRPVDPSTVDAAA